MTLKDYADNSSAIVEGNSPCKVVLQGRTLYKDGMWNTLCLPFDLPLSSSVLHDAEVMTLDGASYRKGTLTLNFAPVTSMIEAERPYIVKWEDGSDMTNPVFLGVTLSTANNPVVIDNVISLQGIYSPLEIPAEDNTKLYMGANNKLYYPSAAMKMNPSPTTIGTRSMALVSTCLPEFQLTLCSQRVYIYIMVRRSSSNDDNRVTERP